MGTCPTEDQANYDSAKALACMLRTIAEAIEKPDTPVLFKNETPLPSKYDFIERLALVSERVGAGIDTELIDEDIWVTFALDRQTAEAAAIRIRQATLIDRDAVGDTAYRILYQLGITDLASLSEVSIERLTEHNCPPGTMKRITDYAAANGFQLPDRS
jgi:hypothetical protein